MPLWSAYSAFEYIRSLWLKTFLFITQPIITRWLPDPYTNAGNVRVDARPTYESRVTMTEIITPAHANTKGLAYAGTVLGWIDVAAGIAAKRHASVPSVTRSVDDVAFLHPVKVGDILTIQASVNKSWKTSMEVGVKVEAESPLTAERVFVAHAYLTFVALSPRPSPKTYLGRKLIEYQPIRVPEVIPYSQEEIKRYDMAESRRQARFARKAQDLKNIRQLFQAWSQGLRHDTGKNAPIIPHPALYAVEPEGASNNINSNNADDSPSQSPRDRLPQRRYSTDPRMMPMSEKAMATTFAEVVELVMPQHANTLSITFGGQIMAWMELCALTSAHRLTKAYLLTASIDSLNFITPTRVGDVVTVRSIVSRTFKSSMEVYVSVEAENLQTGQVNFTNDGFFTITAMDEKNVPVLLPHAIPHTEAEVELLEGSDDRRKKRLTQRQELINLVSATTPHTLQTPLSP